MATARTAVLGIPNGDAVLRRLLETQRVAVATAIDHVFIGTLSLALIVLVMAIGLREIRLRHSFETEVEAPDIA